MLKPCTWDPTAGNLQTHHSPNGARTSSERSTRKVRELRGRDSESLRLDAVRRRYVSLCRLLASLDISAPIFSVSTSSFFVYRVFPTFSSCAMQRSTINVRATGPRDAGSTMTVHLDLLAPAVKMPITGSRSGWLLVAGFWDSELPSTPYQFELTFSVHFIHSRYCVGTTYLRMLDSGLDTFRGTST